MGLWRIALVLSLLALAQLSCALNTATTPVAEKTTALKKVTELLQQLVVQLADDEEVDAKQHSDFLNLTEASITKASETIETNEATISTLEAQIESAQAVQAQKKNEIATAADSLLEAQQELQLAQNQRMSEKETFQSSSQKLQQSTESLNLALETVNSLFGGTSASSSESTPSPPPAAAAPSAAGLLQAAKKLRTALDAGAGSLLDSTQQQLLTRLFSATGDGKAVRQKKKATARRPKASVPVGFLQVARESAAEEEAADEALDEGLEGESGPEVGDLTSTLTEVKEQTESENVAITQAEQKSATDYKKLAESLQQEVDVRQAAVTEIQSVISASEEAESRDKTELLSSQRLLSVTKQQLTQLRVDFSDKKKDYEERVKSRTKEAEAVNQTLTLLTADQAAGQAAAADQAALAQQTSQSSAVSFVQIQQTHTALSFVQNSQLRQASRRKAAMLMSKATSPGLAALLMQSQSTLGRAPVLKKVKDMIHEMLGKLQEQQAQDSQRDTWCKTEVDNTNSAKDNKATKSEKLKTRMLAYEAELSTLQAEIAASTQDVDDMQAALLAQEELRAQESEKARSDIIMYQEDQKVLREALVVLKRVYPEATASADESGYQANAKGSGVVGLLEISLDQFTNLEQETDRSEKEAKADFEDMKSTTQIRKATFEKDLEYKGSRQTQLQGELVTAKNDYDSYQNEIKALDDYLKEVEASCVVKGTNFEERKQKREAQLESLKEALEYLNEESA